jgi:plasmid stabilization system protein ParE
MSYQIYFSPEADNDMTVLESYIRDELKSPSTASKYMKELDRVIRTLSLSANIRNSNQYIRAKFGMDARRIIYKKMAIIFTIVYIKRVIPGSLVY